MCAKFGCGPTVVSKKWGGGGTDRQRDNGKLQLYIYLKETISSCMKRIARGLRDHQVDTLSWCRALPYVCFIYQPWAD